MVQPVLLMYEQLAAILALCKVALVNIPYMVDQLIIA
jgi:hypothetical protein